MKPARKCRVSEGRGWERCSRSRHVGFYSGCLHVLKEASRGQQRAPPPRPVLVSELVLEHGRARLLAVICGGACPPTPELSGCDRQFPALKASNSSHLALCREICLSRSIVKTREIVRSEVEMIGGGLGID